MRKKAYAVLFVAVSTVGIHSIALGAVSDGDCDIDDMMNSNRVTMDQMAVNEYKKAVEEPLAKQIESAPNVKDASCLPILDTLDTLIRAKIPSITSAMGSILAKLRDMACSYANDFISSVVGKMQYNISDPYGIASVGVGGSTSAGGTQVETYDFGKVVSDAVQQAARQKAAELANEGRNSVVSGLPSATSDRLPRVENEVNKGISGALNGL